MRRLLIAISIALPLAAQADALRALDIPYVALNPGASYRGLHDSLVNYLGNRQPQMLLCLHEEAAVAIAHGYAKVTGKAMAAELPGHDDRRGEVEHVAQLACPRSAQPAHVVTQVEARIGLPAGSAERVGSPGQRLASRQLF
mgnify:CR=1 FL=1